MTSNNRLTFCTLFSKEYLVQGITLINSIKKHHPNSKIFVLALDLETTNLLKFSNVKNCYVVSILDSFALTDYFNSFILQRSFAESIFSIKPIFIESVLRLVPSDEILLYLDADTFLFTKFFDDEVNYDSYSIFLSPHYFITKSNSNLITGEFNAGHVGFRNTLPGRDALKLWSDLCIDWCYTTPNAGRYADQKYLETLSLKWESKVSNFSYGVNVGNWSLANDTEIQKEGNVILINDKNLISFHFHGLRIFRYFVSMDINRYGKISNSRSIKTLIYLPYIDEIKLSSVQIKKIKKHLGLKFKSLKPMKNNGKMLLKSFYRKELIIMNTRGKNEF